MTVGNRVPHKFYYQDQPLHKASSPWVDKMEHLCTPEKVFGCNGSEEENPL
jgi:GTP-dependent phosphoenolpyruvate carboxykinase